MVLLCPVFRLRRGSSLPFASEYPGKVFYPQKATFDRYTNKRYFLLQCFLSICGPSQFGHLFVYQELPKVLFGGSSAEMQDSRTIYSLTPTEGIRSFIQVFP